MRRTRTRHEVGDRLLRVFLYPPYSVPHVTGTLPASVRSYRIGLPPRRAHRPQANGTVVLSNIIAVVGSGTLPRKLRSMPSSEVPAPKAAAFHSRKSAKSTIEFPSKSP